MNKKLLFLLVCCFSLGISFRWQSFYPQRQDSCNNFDNENACRGNQTDNDDSWGNRSFQTPPRGDPLWSENYQDFNILVGYARTIYTSGRQSASVEIYTRVNPAYSGLQLKYFFNDEEKTESTFYVNSQYKNLLKVKVEGYKDGKKVATLIIDEVDFVWNHPTVVQPSSFKSGQKGVIVEMFGWPYDDIAEECPMLGKAGYLGVKVFPPQEAILDF